MRKTLLIIGLVLICLMGLVAGAQAEDTADVIVTVSTSFCIDYVSRPGYDEDAVDFYIGVDDFNEGSQGIMNRGDLNWCANVAPWEITVVRTEWDASDGWGDHGTSDIHLEIKKGPDDNTGWVSVYPVRLGGPDVWLTNSDNEEGNPVGTGTFTGVDWKVKQIGWNDASPYGWLSPGVYTCVVTFTIGAP